jgi:polysaccharide chain length determinant protein (PEP-CTERM system associated)
MTWNQYLDIAVRRRWYLLGPLFALGLASIVVANLWPARYRSEALVVVDHQKVPEQYVAPNVATSLEDWLQSMTQQVESSRRLQPIVEELGLYPKERAHLPMETVLQKMRSDISVDPVKVASHRGESTVFRLSYIGPSPAIAKQVNERLTAAFINENMHTRTQESASTTAFLGTQLEQAQQNLAEKEARMREYKQKYLGQLPEQEQGNLQIMNSLETQLAASSLALDRAQEQKSYLESMVAQFRSVEPRDGNSNPTTPDGVLRGLRAKLTELESKYNPGYPEIVRVKEEISKWETIKQQGGGSDVAASAKGPAPSNDPVYIELQSRLKSVRAEAENKSKEVASLRKRLQEIQGRVGVVPVRQQELAEIQREYETARQNYQSLQQMKAKSELATSMEVRQQGEQIRVLDAASFPRSPAEPNRVLVILGGWFLGILAGVALVTLKEMMDPKVFGEEEVVKITQLPILVSLPVLRSRWEEARRKEQWHLEVAAVAVLFALAIGFSVFTVLAG